MAIYKNNNQNEKSIFSSVDFDDTNNVAFFFVKHELDIEKAKESLVAAGQTILAQSYVKGRTVLVTQGTISKEELFDKISTAQGDKFEQVPPEKQTPLKFIKEKGWKIRGGSSVVGQSMTLFSAFNAVSAADAKAGKLTPKFDPSIGAFAVLNLAANFINFVFGGQKEEDVKGLEKFDGIIADEINRYLPEGDKRVTTDDVRKLSYMNDKELAEHNKDRSTAGVLKRNSVRLGEVGLRTLGSLAMVFNYRKVGAGFKELTKGNLKQAFLTAKTEDKFTFTAGLGMVAGKIAGLFTQTQDPNNPPTTYWGEIRQKVLWPISSWTEMVAQSSLVYDRAVNKKLVLGGKPHFDVTGTVGNVALAYPSYPFRMVLPYGQKVLDIDEIQARLLDRLPQIPQDKVPEVMARVTSRMVEHLGNNAPSFSELYSKLLNKMDNYHGITVLPHHKADMVQETPPAENPQKNWANDLATRLANSPPIPDEPRKTGYAEKNPKKDYVNQPHLESSGASLAL